MPRTVQFTETESGVVGARGWGVSVSGGVGRQCFLQGEKVPEADGGDRGAKQREPAQRHRTAHLGWGAAVHSVACCSVAVRSVACYCRSQFKKVKMKKEEEKHIVSFGEDQRQAADERRLGRPGAGVGPYAKVVGGCGRGTPPRAAGTQLQPPEAGRAGPPGLHAEQGETRLLRGSEAGRDILEV